MCTTKSDEEKANILGEFSRSEYTKEPTGEIPKLDDRLTTGFLKNVDITNDRVQKILEKLKTNKSPVVDGLHLQVLKELKYKTTGRRHENIATNICVIRRLETGQHHANFQKGHKKSPNNYRPVSLTSIPCKCMEKIIRDEIVTHMKSNNLFSDKQFGFISGRSTVLQFLHVLDKWTESIDKGHSSDVFTWFFRKF